MAFARVGGLRGERWSLMGHRSYMVVFLLWLFILILVLCFLQTLDNFRLLGWFSLLFNLDFIGLIWIIWLLQSLGAVFSFAHYDAPIPYKILEA